MCLETKSSMNGFDKKGNLILEQFGTTALIVRFGKDGKILPKELTPYVVARHYDPETGEWSYGSYYSHLGHAYEEANPDIIERSCIRWELDDLKEALSNQGIAPTPDMIRDFRYELHDLKWWREKAIGDGNDFLDDEAYLFVQKLKETN